MTERDLKLKEIERFEYEIVATAAALGRSRPGSALFELLLKALWDVIKERKDLLLSLK